MITLVSMGTASQCVRLDIATDDVFTMILLPIGRARRLQLNPRRDFDSTGHILLSRLLNGPSPLCGENITLTLKSASYTTEQYSSLRTNQSGYAWLALYLSPQVNSNQTAFNVVASFAGDSASTATASMTTLNGTTYDVCTTTQYDYGSAVGYEPSANSTSILVMPQTTTGVTTLKSSDEMVKEAEASGGGLSVYPEFSWLYPWFRMHFAWKYNGQTMLDIGVAPLPFVDTASFPPSTFKDVVSTSILKIALNILLALLATQAMLWAASNWGLLGFGMVLGGYLAYKFASLYLSWDSVTGLYTSLASNLISTAYATYTGLCSFLPSSLQALAAGAESIKSVAFAFLCKLIMIPINIVMLMLAWGRIQELGGA